MEETYFGLDSSCLLDALVVRMMLVYRNYGIHSPRKALRVHAIPVPSGLHLKCFCSALDADTVIVANGCLPEGCFSTVNTVVEIPKNEAYGANLLCRGRHVVMASDMPVTEGILRGLGYTVTSLSLSEIRKADGALTCMSVWF